MKRTLTEKEHLKTVALWATIYLGIGLPSVLLLPAWWGLIPAALGFFAAYGVQAVYANYLASRPAKAVR